MTHDHSRPGRAAQLATMALIRAIIADDRAAIRRAAVAGGCPACNAVAVATYGFTLVLWSTGQPAMTPEIASAILAVVEATEAELRSAPN
jgi:hypothetical protein